MSCDWQALVSEAATQAFLRNGSVPAFRLKRGDLVDLCAQITKRTPDSIRADLAITGVVAVRCEVHCEPLSRAVVVDEWTVDTATFARECFGPSTASESRPGASTSSGTRKDSN
jgi:hypothetical protein